MIEPRPAVLPCNGGCQLYHLPLIEIFSQPRKQFIRRINRRPRHSDGIVEDEFLHCRECAALLVDRKLAKLLLTDPVSSAHGRTDVDSPRTADQGGHFDLGEFFQARINLFRAFERHLDRRL
jgi:hypothetical protein